MKRFLCLMIVFLLVCFCSNNVCADDSLGLAAPSSLLMDASSGKVLYEHNSKEKRPCASITKVMTMCLTFEAIEDGRLNEDDVVTISPHAAAQPGSDIWLVEGEQMTVRDLLKSVAVVSANDASVALAEAVSGTESAFVAEMNSKAKLLGMNDTVFKNCTGLDEDGHLTTAYDVALMSRELMRHEKVFGYVSIWLDYIRDGATQLVNTNRLINSYSGIIGLKTGTTTLAGACISAAAERDGSRIIAVVLGDKTTDERFNDAAKLLDYGFTSFGMTKPEIPEGIPKSINVKNGMRSSVQVAYEPNGEFLVKNEDMNNIEAEVHIADEATAPIQRGQRLGNVSYRLGGEMIGEFPITAVESVDEINFKDVFSLLFFKFLPREAPGGNTHT